MNLNELRGQIDQIDRQMQELFQQRMELAGQVAEYKKEHHLPIFQSRREEEILDRIAQRSAPGYENGARVLFTNLMDISKCLQQSRIHPDAPLLTRLREEMAQSQPLPARPRVACQGVPGAYSHIAADRMFPEKELSFLATWEEVFQAVEEGRVDFGVLPIENSSAGSVRGVYELMRRHDFYINREQKIRVEHCLAVRPGVELSQVTEILSHEQAIAQCSEFLAAHREIPSRSVLNTALAAQMAARSPQPIAAICSQLGAKEYGLTVLKQGIQNNEENYTRFIGISKRLYPSREADTVAAVVSVPNASGALYRMLTKFYVNQVNMTKIESRPVGNKHFDAYFYLNFTGNLYESNIQDLIGDLSRELEYFKFLGCYQEDHLADEPNP